MTYSYHTTTKTIQCAVVDTSSYGRNNCTNHTEILTNMVYMYGTCDIVIVPYVVRRQSKFHLRVLSVFPYMYSDYGWILLSKVSLHGIRSYTYKTSCSNLWKRWFAPQVAVQFSVPLNGVTYPVLWTHSINELQLSELTSFMDSPFVIIGANAFLLPHRLSPTVQYKLPPSVSDEQMIPFLFRTGKLEKFDVVKVRCPSPGVVSISRSVLKV